MLKNFIAQPITYVLLGIDETGSMGGHRPAAIAAYNAKLAELRRQSETQDIRLATFPIRERAYTGPISWRHPHQIQDLTQSSYRSDAPGTAITDTVMQVLEHAEDWMSAALDAAFLCLVVTDGGDNTSRQRRDVLGRRIQGLAASDRWTFAFAVPPSQVHQIRTSYGIPSGNIEAWDATTTEGFEAMARSSVRGMSQYFTGRSKGVTRSETFYRTTNITPTDSKRIVQEARPIHPGTFKEFIIPDRMEIKEFFLAKKIPFSTGRLYYELTKTETIQPGKVLVLQDRDKPSVMYTGNEARHILNLDASGNLKVTPGNHAQWRIFVQSTSNNRKLDKGTVVLIA